MGASPEQGWIQRVTIEIPGPVDPDAWAQYKQDVEVVLERYRMSVRAKIKEIAFVRVAPEEEGPTPGPNVTISPVTRGRRAPKKKAKR